MIICGFVITLNKTHYSTFEIRSDNFANSLFPWIFQSRSINIEFESPIRWIVPPNIDVFISRRRIDLSDSVFKFHNFSMSLIGSRFFLPVVERVFISSFPNFPQAKVEKFMPLKEIFVISVMSELTIFYPVQWMEVLTVMAFLWELFIRRMLQQFLMMRYSNKIWLISYVLQLELSLSPILHKV